MNWFKQIVVKWVREDWKAINTIGENTRFSGRGATQIGIPDVEEMEDPIRFELQAAIGGRILKVRHPYDRKLDRHESSTYIIAQGEDVGARVAKIINLELMK